MEFVVKEHSKLYNFFNITKLTTGQLTIFFLCLYIILFSESFLITTIFPFYIESEILTWELLFGCLTVYNFLGVIFCYTIVNLARIISNKTKAGNK